MSLCRNFGLLMHFWSVSCYVTLAAWGNELMTRHSPSGFSAQFIVSSVTASHRVPKAAKQLQTRLQINYNQHVWLSFFFSLNCSPERHPDVFLKDLHSFMSAVIFPCDLSPGSRCSPVSYCWIINTDFSWGSRGPCWCCECCSWLSFWPCGWVTICFWSNFW